MVSKHSSPRDLPLGHDLRKFGQHGFRVPRRALSVQLITSKDNEIGSLGIENFCKESRGKVVRAVAWGDRGVAANTRGDREMQVGNLEDPELPVSGEVQRWCTRWT